MVVDDGAGEQRGQWRGSMDDSDRTGQAKDGDDDDDDDDKNESDETLSLSYLTYHHATKILLLSAQGAHDSPTRVAARLHPIVIARPRRWRRQSARTGHPKIGGTTL